MAVTARPEVRTGRLDYLDALRGIAAAAVAAGHYVEIATPSYMPWTFENFSPGRAGVVAFFLVSGYVIPMSLERATFGSFWTARFFRLFPSYWTNIVIILALGAVALGPMPDGGWPVLAVNVLMIQLFLLMPNIVAPAWTLGIELMFYVQSSALRRFGRLPWGVWFGYGWLAAFVLAGCVAPAVGFTDLPITVPLLLFTASLGQAVYRWQRGMLTTRSLAALFGAGVAALSATSWVNFAVFAPPPEITVLGPVQWTPTGYALSYLGGLALFGGFFLLRGRRFPKSMTWLGRISYSLYLVHPAVYGVVLAFFAPTNPLAGLLYVTALLLVSWALYRLVETPSIQLGRRLAGRRLGPPAGIESDAR